MISKPELFYFMRTNKLLCFFLLQIAFMALPLKSIGQVKLSFVPTIGGAEISLDKEYLLKELGKVTFTKLKFYFGLAGDTSSKSYFLIDLKKKSSCLVEFPLQKNSLNNEFAFCCGVYSFTNTSGVYMGALDPLNGMYWTWQSGYINWKLEGTAAAAPTRNHEFHFHIGGYSAPFATLTPVILKVDNQQNVNVFVDLHRFLNGIDLKTENNIMIPGHNAVRLAKKAGTIFYTNP